WQAVTTRAWLERLAADPDGTDVYVLDGQTRPSFIRSAVERVGAALVRVVLLDCAAHARHARLTGPRGQPELSHPRMDCWAMYLRGQADAFDLPVIARQRSRRERTRREPCAPREERHGHHRDGARRGRETVRAAQGGAS